MGLLDYDLKSGVRWVAGADEAGRGCIAGPLVAAGVLLDLREKAHLARVLSDINDSKQLTAKRRRSLYVPVMQAASKWVILIYEPSVIDRDGIHVVNLRGLGESLRRVSGHLDQDVVRISDGFKVKDLDLPHEGMVKGDATSAAVAAASILAKETRDRLMVEHHQTWPQYGFDRHAGYPTKEHKQALDDHGVCLLHRRSYAPVRAVLDLRA